MTDDGTASPGLARTAVPGLADTGDPKGIAGGVRARALADEFTSQMDDSEAVTGDLSLETVLDLLEDEYVRSILEATRAEPLSATELADRCDASLSTIGRRLDSLEAANLVRERTRPRADGHHDTIYVATLAEFRLHLESSGFSFQLRRRDEDVADRLQRLWGDL